MTLIEKFGWRGSAALLLAGVCLLVVAFGLNSQPLAANAPPPAATQVLVSDVIPLSVPTLATAEDLPTVKSTQDGDPEIPSAGPGSARLLFVGDVMLGRGIAPVRKENGNSFPLAQVAAYIRGADLSFGNLESPLTNLPYFRGGFNLHAEPSAVESLALAGFDWVSVANNHSGDFGRQGMSDTLAALRTKSIAWAGGGNTEAETRKPAVKNVNGLRVVLLAYDGTKATIEASGNLAGSQWLSLSRAASDIKAARDGGADIIIVAVHWGVEYAPLPSTDQKNSARQLVANGADLVIGSHPHVVEPVEWITRPNGRTSLVAYSLGNFLFDQWFSEPVMEGVIMRVIVDKQGVAALNLIPTKNTTGQTRIQPLAAAAGEMLRLLPSGNLPPAWQRNATQDADGRTWWRRP
jgi:poly-gamma-glutamate capsule biosynthesis protein CapA/YwtB (metallophosphatase superfamily)